MLLADLLRVPVALSLIGAAYLHNVPLAISAIVASGFGSPLIWIDPNDLSDLRKTRIVLGTIRSNVANDTSTSSFAF